MRRDRPDLPTSDALAVERTLLANERTFLAYFRTAVVFLTSGVAILKIDMFEPIQPLSFLLVGLAPLILAFGVWRLRAVKRRIERRLPRPPEA